MVGAGRGSDPQPPQTLLQLATTLCETLCETLGETLGETLSKTLGETRSSKWPWQVVAAVTAVGFPPDLVAAAVAAVWANPAEVRQDVEDGVQEVCQPLASLAPPFHQPSHIST